MNNRKPLSFFETPPKKKEEKKNNYSSSNDYILPLKSTSKSLQQQVELLPKETQMEILIENKDEEIISNSFALDANDEYNSSPLFSIKETTHKETNHDEIIDLKKQIDFYSKEFYLEINSDVLHNLDCSFIYKLYSLFSNDKPLGVEHTLNVLEGQRLTIKDIVELHFFDDKNTLLFIQNAFFLNKCKEDLLNYLKSLEYVRNINFIQKDDIKW